jgi:DNA repair exonuclease SbcCD ATPase subunit
MKIKHKVVKEFQYLSPDKRIFVLKAGTILEEYDYKLKADIIPIDKEIVDNNPEFFEVVDWKSELLSYMRANKLPQPAQLGKKLIPFIEEMIISGMQTTTESVKEDVVEVDNSKIKEIERKEIDLNSREKRIIDKEDELEIRTKRIEKRESEYKEDLKRLDKRESDVREKSKENIEKELDLDDKLQDLNERERNLDRNALESTKEVDKKYSELKKKIDKDLKDLANREKELESKVRELANREQEFSSNGLDAEDCGKKLLDSKYAFEDLEDILSGISIVSDLLSDFTSRPFTMEYLQSIHSDLKSRIDSAKKRISKEISSL